MFYVAVAGLLIVNALGVAMVALQLPGTWVVLLASAGFALLYPQTLGWWTVAILLGLAVIGEAIETLAGAAGARKAGGTKRAMLGAVAGGIVGAIVGTALIPILLVGTLAGAMAGAGVGSIVGDRWAGRPWGEAWSAGKGAAWGKLWGTLGKLAVAALMWITAAAALLWRGDPPPPAASQAAPIEASRLAGSDPVAAIE